MGTQLLCSGMRKRISVAMTFTDSEMIMKEGSTGLITNSVMDQAH